jgi:hypothetical protein
VKVVDHAMESESGTTSSIHASLARQYTPSLPDADSSKNSKQLEDDQRSGGGGGWSLADRGLLTLLAWG